ncbi:hypothetical protein ALNOE001_20670 [Candidatus Methanobinarius endosymbioticus]|uniref:Uncharacterized protein n=1 Tax=Candidatus Methanobinarius endosymbioticus TaxID=2006182 RepID=A0A366M9V2_9EURY|nr:hypothetical protein ALNOE001_20670 [Candidatus Methanobinarius endosymbioticus]
MAAIAISIWIIYFTILDMDKNPKYFLLAFPLFIIGFLQYILVVFILPLMIIYILFDIDIIQKIKLILSRKKYSRKKYSNKECLELEDTNYEKPNNYKKIYRFWKNITIVFIKD